MTALRLTSLLLVQERLSEADYFARRIRRSPPHHLEYSLNAFLSAARSVTFLLQKEMAHVPGFAEWLELKRQKLGADPAARFFHLQRNFSQKEGRVRTIGFRDSNSKLWTYRFAGGAHPTPPELHDRDVAECCSEHVAKLARLTLEFAEAFPFHSCPHRALTSEGVSALGLSLADVNAAADLPAGWFDVAPADLEAQLAGVRTLVDEVDFEAIRRLTGSRRRSGASKDGDYLMRRLLLDHVQAGPKGYAMIAAGLLLGGIPGDDTGK